MERKFKIVLASSSMRRCRLLEQLGIPFTVADPGEVEITFGEPKKQVVINATAKAKKIAERMDRGVVIGADTIVVKKGHVIRKPTDSNEAKNILKKLSGGFHKVITGVAIIDASSGRIETDVAETMVHVKDLCEDEIDSYLATGEPFGKAGGYAIQGIGALLVDYIQGCFYNVVGLPLSKLDGLLKRIDVHILDQIKREKTRIN
jgi:septum formation protein